MAATAAFICIGSLVSLVSDGMAFNQGFTTTWFLCAMIPMAIGACLPNLRYRQLKVRLAQVRDPMLTALAMYHQQSGHTFDVAAASHHTLEVTSTRIAPSLADIASRRSSIEFLAGRVREARLVQTRMPLGQADNASVDSDQPETTAPTHEEPPSVPIFDGAAPFEVELIVRMLLAQPGSTESRYRARGLGARGATVPTTQAVEQALWLYAAAIEEFRDDPVDLVLVKIEYSRFVHCFTADLNMATSALDAAERERPGLEGSFAIFTRLKQLARQRAARNNGFVSAEDGDRASLDYTKRLSASLQLHENALKHRSRMYRAIQVRQGTFSADDQSMADRLGGIIDAVTEATSEANRKYVRGARRFPGDSLLVQVGWLLTATCLLLPPATTVSSSRTRAALALRVATPCFVTMCSTTLPKPTSIARRRLPVTETASAVVARTAGSRSCPTPSAACTNRAHCTCFVAHTWLTV